MKKITYLLIVLLLSLQQTHAQVPRNIPAFEFLRNKSELLLPNAQQGIKNAVKLPNAPRVLAGTLIQPKTLAKKEVTPQKTTVNRGVASGIPTPVITGNTIICAGNPTQLSASVDYASANTLPSYVPTSGLLGYWPFSGNSNDVSGTGNNGTIAGATLSTDRNTSLNSAYTFDGNSEIDCGTASSLNIDECTLSAWVYLSTTSTTPYGYQAIISKYDSNLGSYALGVVGDKAEIWFQIDADNAVVVDSNTSLSTNQWYHITATHNADGVQLYINGVLDNSINRVFNVLQAPDDVLRIGAQGPFFPVPIQNGKIDDVGLWNRALSSSEIYDLANSNNITYSWSPNGETTQQITVTSPGVYEVTVTDANANTATGFVSVTNNEPLISASGPTTFCTGGAVTLSATMQIIPVDVVPEAALAIGLRRLKSNYNGPALRLRRGSDNAEQDFGFVGSNLDTQAILSWLNGATGYCTTLYNQSGDASGNVIQTDGSQQPTFVANGINGKSVLHFDTSQTMLNEINYTTPYSVIYGARLTGGSDRVLASVYNNWLLGYWGGAMDQAFFDGWVSPQQDPSADQNYHIYAATGTGSVSTVYENGNQLFSNNRGLSGPNGIKLNGWGNGTIGGSSYCDFTDVIVYNKVLTESQITVLNTSISQYYGANTNLANAGASYLWSPNGETTAEITVSTSGDYSVTVDAGNGCSNTSANTTITVIPASNVIPVISTVGSVHEFCAGGSLILTSSEATGNIWSTGETTQSITVYAAGDYSVSANCSPLCAAFTVNERALPTPSITGNPIICTGGTITLDAGTGYASYLWSPNNETTQTISVGVEDTFSVTVTDDFGCSGTSDTIQTAFSTASVALSNLGTSCLGTAQLALSGDVSTLSSVQWYNNATPIGSAITIPLPTVVAGGNSAGTASNQLNQPAGITVDGAGNVYVADTANNRIQKWTPGATEGITIAGGNGAGPAANQLNFPFGVAFDAAGNLYVSDVLNSRIQKWAPSATEGITVAGGNGAGPDTNQLNEPSGIAVDTNGNLYVADIQNHRIQKWAPNATEGITVAGGHGQGSDANQFSYPYDLAVDAAGNVYVADAGNSRVQKWAPNATEGITVAGGHGAGNPANQLALPISLHVDASETVFIADLFGSRVMKWGKGATEGVVVAGGAQQAPGANPLINPVGVFVTNSGEIYVSNLSGSSIQKWESYHQSFTPTTAGSYTAVVTNVHGCTTTTNAVVVNNSVAGTVSSNQLIFIGSKPANITLTGSEGAVQWQSSLNNSTFADIAGATGTTLTSTQMGALTTKRYYRAVITDGSCTATSGVVTVNVVASTKVKTSQCGKTLASIESTISADVVVNANKYLFEVSKDNAVVQELPGTISYIRLTSLTAGAQYETTYSIRVKTSSDNGVTWSNYGTACSVTTPAPTTKVQASQCGKTLALINSNLLADVVMYANQYQFEISKDNSVVQELTSSKYYTLLTNLTAGAKYGTTYSIRVKTSGDNGVTWSKYGAPCSVITPAAPLTKVKASQCGTTLASIDNTILADVVLYANKYQFEISKDNSVLQELTSTTSYTRLTNLTAGAKYGTTYSIRVKTSGDNGITWSIYGAPCTVKTPAAPLTKIKATQCGQNLALINSILSADVVIYANKYRFEISKNNSVVQELTSTTYYTRLTSLTAGAQYGTTYSIRVKTSFDNGLTWSEYGSACTVITPSAPLTRPVDSVTETELATFKVTGYPNPYTETFKLDITTQSNATVNVTVYDMVGKLIEVRNSGVAELGTLEIGDRYATGVYNVIVTQDTEVKTLRMIKK